MMLSPFKNTQDNRHTTPMKQSDQHSSRHRSSHNFKDIQNPTYKRSNTNNERTGYISDKQLSNKDSDQNFLNRQ